MTEPIVPCANCAKVRPVGDMLYDEYCMIYLCGRTCFDEWHDANSEVVGDYYYYANIGY